ncbi:MAG: tetratricopeptide repeat protein [candidate division KSB1 bacterium]|nr:tetratricopeptide repeat protein [candidate division KSB1 bacterium]
MLRLNPIPRIWSKKCHLLMVLTLLVVITASHGMAQDHVTQAGKFFFLKDYGNAIKEYQLALRQNPNDPQIHYNLATCYEKVGDIESAINSYRQALRLRPDFTLAQQALNKLLSSSQGQALQEMQATLLKANNAFFTRNYDEAIAHYTRVIQLDPQNFIAYFNLAFCHEQKENYALALRLYEQALALNKDSEEAQVAVQRMQTVVKDQKISKLKTQIEIELAGNRFEQALESVEQILTIEPGNSWALNLREVLRRRLQEQAKASEADSVEAAKVAMAEAARQDSLREDSLRIASQQGKKLDLPYVYLLLGVVLVSGVLIALLVSRGRKKAPATEDLLQKGVYGTLQEYFNIRKTGILSATGTTPEGESIQGEVRILKGNIVDAHTNKMEGVPALHQLLALEQPNHLSFQEVQVSPSGNIHQATLPLLMQWTLGMKKEG